MGSKMLTGSMLVIGPPMALLLLIFVDPASFDESFAVQSKQVLDNTVQSIIGGLGAIIGMLGVVVGTAYLARSMQGEERPGADIAGLAAILAILIAGTLVVVTGLHVAILDAEWVSKGGNSEAAYAMADGIFTAVFLGMGVVLFLLGIAIFLQKTFHQILGCLATLIGACLVVGVLMGTDEGIGGLLRVIGFFGWFIITMVFGGLTIKSAR